MFCTNVFARPCRIAKSEPQSTPQLFHHHTLMFHLPYHHRHRFRRSRNRRSSGPACLCCNDWKCSKLRKRGSRRKVSRGWVWNLWRLVRIRAFQCFKLKLNWVEAPEHSMSVLKLIRTLKSSGKSSRKIFEHRLIDYFHLYQ